jgi:hypothetical protein
VPLCIVAPSLLRPHWTWNSGETAGRSQNGESISRPENRTPTSPLFGNVPTLADHWDHRNSLQLWNTPPIATSLRKREAALRRPQLIPGNRRSPSTGSTERLENVPSVPGLFSVAVQWDSISTTPSSPGTSQRQRTGVSALHNPVFISRVRCAYAVTAEHCRRLNISALNIPTMNHPRPSLRDRTGHPLVGLESVQLRGAERP